MQSLFRTCYRFVCRNARMYYLICAYIRVQSKMFAHFIILFKKIYDRALLQKKNMNKNSPKVTIINSIHTRAAGTQTDKRASDYIEQVVFNSLH
jgi:hypothetical protein